MMENEHRSNAPDKTPYDGRNSGPDEAAVEDLYQDDTEDTLQVDDLNLDLTGPVSTEEDSGKKKSTAGNTQSGDGKTVSVTEEKAEDSRIPEAESSREQARGETPAAAACPGAAGGTEKAPAAKSADQPEDRKPEAENGADSKAAAGEAGNGKTAGTDSGDVTSEDAKTGDAETEDAEAGDAKIEDVKAAGIKTAGATSEDAKTGDEKAAAAKAGEEKSAAAQAKTPVKEKKDLVYTGKTEPADPEKKKKVRRRVLLAAVICAAVLAVSAFGWYCAESRRYAGVFFPNTTLNGIDVSQMTAEEAKKSINDQVAGYQITVKSRGNSDEIIRGTDVGLTYAFDSTIDQLIAGQKPLDWYFHRSQATDYKVDTLAKIDDGSFSAAVGRLVCMDKTRFTKPADARISDYQKGSGYTVIPEQTGNVLDTAKAAELIRKSIVELQKEINLETAGDSLYENPQVLSTDDKLNKTCKNLNQYVLTEIDYTDGKGAVLDGSTVKDWISLGSDLSVAVDQDKVAAWVKNLAGQYDTLYKPKMLHTSWGTDVKITEGIYGWKMNQAAEKEFILKTLPTGKKVERAAEFSRKAASHGENDYGNTYVEVNLTMQHLYYYKNGSVVVSSDFVSGCTSKGRGTPTGIYQVAYKDRNATLRGQGYASPVDYWMPFNAGVGLHDASWRSTFGGKIYVTSGSHGCINLPHSAAETIFNNLDAGCPVIVYNMDGSSSGPATEEAKEEQGLTETTAAPTEPAATAAATTAAPKTEHTTAAGTVPAKETTASAVQPKGPGTAATTGAAEESAAASTENTQATVSAGPGAGLQSSGASESSRKGPGE